MKTTCPWQLNVKDFRIMSGLRKRPHLKRPLWIIILVTFVIIFLITAYVSPLSSSTACYFFSSGDCTLYQSPSFPARELSDEETISQVVIKEILNTPPIQSADSKIAFLFLTPGTLPFELLWDKFFRVILCSLVGHEGRFSVYVHASREKPGHTSQYFIGRDIHSENVDWGKISMVDAERRLLAHALLDPDNLQFVLLSDRYSERMMPEVEKTAFRKGSQWFSMKRQHAIIIMADTFITQNFGFIASQILKGAIAMQTSITCQPFLMLMIDPGGIANRSVTYVDWSEGKWHPRSFRAEDISFEFLKNLSSIDDGIHITSDPKRRVFYGPCLWNNVKRPCYLFARKFYPDTLNRLLINFSNYTAL
ncbi:hypothetical protein GOBAR_DD26652 [Gossypium barbadense]|nr:hypothetical protein GOBAR_DD26652 [Gossypium barbadense]